MAENKKSFVGYADWNKTFEKLSDDEAGKLAKMIFAYVNDENPEAPDRITELIFEPFKNQLKRDLEKYEEVKKKRSEAGRNGGFKSGISRSNPKQNEANASTIEPKEANASFAKKNEANEAVNDNVTVNVNDTVNVILLEKETKEENIIKENFDSEFFPEKEIETDTGPAKEKEKKVAQKKEKTQPPDLDTFLDAGREIYQNELKLDFSLYEFALKAKYNSWVDAGWKDGHKKPINGWKNKLRNVIPHLKPIYGKSNNFNTNNGAGSKTGNNQGSGFKASGKVSARTLLASRLNQNPSSNSESGNFTIDVEAIE